MKILRLTSSSISPAVAQTFKKTKDASNIYFNIKHGSAGRNLWVYSCGLHSIHFKPVNESDHLELDQDNYILKPIKTKSDNDEKVILKDKLGNTLYNISLDNMQHHKKDIILFWEIPNNKYTNVKYVLEGSCTELGKGWIGKERNDILYKSPAPVLEIQGDCVICWEAIDDNNNKIKQIIKYDFYKSDWDISPIKRVENGTSD